MTGLKKIQRLAWLIMLFLLGSLTAWYFGVSGLPALSTAPTSESEIVATQVLSVQTLTQQGIQAYQAGQLKQAIDLWQQALRQTTNLEEQVILHNNLAKAIQRAGQPNQAIAHWEKAIQLYPPANTDAARRQFAQLLMETAQTYNELGQHRRALEIVDTILKLPITDELILAASQGIMGNAYWALGDYEAALTAHQNSLALSQKSQHSPYITTVLNNLGNLYSSRAARYRDQTKAAAAEGETLEAASLLKLAEQDWEFALKAYQDSLKAVNQLDGLTEIQILLNLNQLLAQAPDRRSPSIQAHRDRILTLLQREAASHEKAYALIRLALERFPQLPQVKHQQQQWLQQALAIAREIGDQRAESYALGSLGELYASANQPAEALKWFRKAQLVSQAIGAADSLYRWQWQAGRILKIQGDDPGAIVAYQQAVATLQSIRSDIIAANRELQFSFRDSVEPVYRELIGLMLDQPSMAREPPDVANQSLAAQAIHNKADKIDLDQQQILAQVLNLLESLKLAELQNFFGDECVKVAAAMANPLIAQTPMLQESISAFHKSEHLGGLPKAKTLIQADPIAPKTAIVYTIILTDRTEVIVRLPNGQMINQSVPINERSVQETVDSLRTLLEKRSTDEYLPQAQLLYDLLIRPLKSILDQAQVKTLVFIQDGVLRKIPMAALHDGQRFLIEYYEVANTPSLSLTSLQPFDRSNLNALILGLTVARSPFPPLANVKVESQEVHTILGGTTLLDQDFTLAQLTSKLALSNYPIVHIATHGKFGVDNTSTFLLSFDTRITIDQLETLLRTRENRQPVELLTLSACQTATGDNRSTLGIAGVAVRAGAKSALATLWYINDEATVPLIKEFYQQLRQPGVTRAQALRTAQISLIQDLDWGHPGVWSPFILIGNWL